MSTTATAPSRWESQRGFDELGRPLRDVTFCVVDLETTGGSAARGSMITEVGAVMKAWSRGTVVRSWLLDLMVRALDEDPNLDQISGYAEDSGEGRWTVEAAIDEGVPAPVLNTALFERFASRGNDHYANQLLSAMRKEFGGHAELPSGDSAEVGETS